MNRWRQGNRRGVWMLQVKLAVEIGRDLGPGDAHVEVVSLAGRGRRIAPEPCSTSSRTAITLPCAQILWKTIWSCGNSRKQAVVGENPDRASDEDRTRVFARYSLIGALSTAAGALAAGAPDLWVSVGMGRIGALQAMFYVYAALGLVGALFYSRLPRAEVKEAAPRATALGPSRRTVYKLAALFSLDSFAGGFTVQSLMALWL